MAILHVSELEVSSAEDHELIVAFDDGTHRRVQLTSLLTGCFEPLRNAARFAEVYLAPPGVPTWPTMVRPEGAPDEDAMQLDLAPEALKEAPVKHSRRGLLPPKRSSPTGCFDQLVGGAIQRRGRSILSQSVSPSCQQQEGSRWGTVAAYFPAA